MLRSTRPALTRVALTVLALSASLVGGVATGSPAVADTMPPSVATPATVSADALPTVQINGVVWAQVPHGNTVYATGKFSSARPPGSPAGTNETVRRNLLAYDITTGKLTSTFAPSLNAPGQVVALSPDGKRLYVGGDFTSANGTAHQRIAAYDTATGKIVGAFAPRLDARVKGIAATNTTVYVGGSFTTANGVPRQRLAAFRASDGALLRWAPSAGGSEVLSMVLTPGAKKVVVAGKFSTLNGVTAPGSGAVDPVTGATLAWPANKTVQNSGVSAAINSLSVDTNTVYGTGFVFGPGGNLEGTFAADADTGTLRWVEDCHGDTYGAYQAGSVVYTVGHAHACGNIGGFPETDPRSFHRALAFTKAATGTIGHDPGGYFDWFGNPRPDLLHWFPNIASGTFTGQAQGAWNVTGKSGYVAMGGEFPTVNGKPQQGLVRFALRTIAPDRIGPQTVAALKPTAVSLTRGTVRVGFKATWDPDNEALTYRVVRDGNTAAPVFTSTIRSAFWREPYIGFTDTGLTPGSSHVYRVFVTDSHGNQTSSPSTSGTAGTSSRLTSYATTILGDSPTSYWRLDEPSGPTGYDWAGYQGLTVGSGVVRGRAGAILGDDDDATGFDGTAASRTTAPHFERSQNGFATEAWIRTTTTAGGKIIGFGDHPTGDSRSYDRHVYMTNSGQLAFGVWSSGTHVLVSKAAYNDGRWHHVVATLGSAGQVLYVDGHRVGQDTATTSGKSYAGYWRIGGDGLAGWPNRPTSVDFRGDIDEVAVYHEPLSIAQVRAHYTASGRSLATGARPPDAYGATVYDDGPDSFWRMDEASGSVAADASPNEVDGIYAGGVTLGSAGILGEPGVALDGVDDEVASSTPLLSPREYSEELWFRTTTGKGGLLIGFGDAQTGASTAFDRQVLMLDSGRLRFAVSTGQANLVDTVDSYNDGRWHHVVAEQDPATGMRLYVDGQLAGSNPQTGSLSYRGYWRAGGDASWGGNTSDYLAGSVDEVAIYPTALTAGQVAAHYASGTGQATNTRPVASFISTSQDLTASFDPSGSADRDGQLTAYAWSFGDGATSSAVAPSHTYAAEGTYQVTLTVTDDKGATGTTARTVTVVKNLAPTARFTSSVSGLEAAFDGSQSTDADGAITSFAWSFGDGATDSGSRPSHVYARSGTYTVSLTVTDDVGATSTVRAPVTASGSAAPFAADAFGRTVSGGFGTADVGGAWSTIGSADNLSVAGGAARFALPTAGVRVGAHLSTRKNLDTDLAVTVETDKVATGGGTYVYVVGRRVSANNEYRARVRFTSSGRVGLALSALKGTSTEAPLAAETLLPGTFAAGAPVKVRVQVVGTTPTTVRARAWAASAAEPPGWLVTATDSTPSVQAAGGVGLSSYLSASATSAPVQTAVLALTAEPVAP